MSRRQETLLVRARFVRKLECLHVWRGASSRERTVVPSQSLDVEDLARSRDKLFEVMSKLRVDHPTVVCWGCGGLIGNHNTQEWIECVAAKRRRERAD